MLHAHYRKTHPVQLRSENIYLDDRLGPSDRERSADPAKQATAWRGDPGPPSAKGQLALIASAVEADPADGGNVLMTLGDEPGRSAEGRHPAVIVSTFGKGRVVYFAAGVDKAMFFYPDTYMRQLLANACRWAAGTCRRPSRSKGRCCLGGHVSPAAGEKADCGPPAQRPQLLRPPFDLSKARSAAQGAAKIVGFSQPVRAARDVAHPRRSAFRCATSRSAAACPESPRPRCSRRMSRCL